MRWLALASVALALGVGPRAVAQTQAEMTAQAGARLTAADQRLNDAYRRLTARATANGRVRLQAAERLWMQYRDANCEAVSGARGGSMRPMLVADCQTRMTEARTKELTAQLQCAEPDMSCHGAFETE